MVNGGQHVDVLMLFLLVGLPDRASGFPNNLESIVKQQFFAHCEGAGKGKKSLLGCGTDSLVEYEVGGQ